MAVYTDVTAEDLIPFLAGYDIGELLALKGIAEGVENSNFLVHTSRGYFILTLYERRVAAGDLPFFLALMEHLASRGITCPQPVKNRAGETLGRLAGRPAAIVTFLDGMWIRRPNAGHCARAGRGAGAAASCRRRFSPCGATTRCRSPAGGSSTQPAARAPTRCSRDLDAVIATELDVLERDWPRGLPQGVIHADLFPDNVFFLGDRLSGLIDFYFACTDTLAYDVAICLNAWCFEPDHSYNVTKGRALLKAYGRRAPLSAPEWRALPLLARGAAMRFLLTRLVDWLAVPPGALVRPKDPLEYFAQAALPPDGQERARLRMIAPWERFSVKIMRRKTTDQRVTIHTDGACSGNPGPGGWGAILTFGDHEKELHGGEAHTTNNRMELMAAISALEALKRPCVVDLHTDSEYLTQRHHQLDPRLEEERLAYRRQETGQERRSVEAARCRRWPHQRCTGIGCRATPATP